MSRAFCSKGQHYPEEIVARSPNLELGVVQDNEGVPTGYFVDGIFGVSDEDYWESMTDEEPVCAEHTDCYITWDHS